MKTLLVAFDFSKNAVHALEYAFLYAKQLGADIHLLWVDNSISDAALGKTIEEELRIEKKNYLKKIVNESAVKEPDVKMAIHLGKGKVYQEIAKTAQRIKADIIFTGTHGVSGYEQYWIGSNAYRITTSAPCPVVTVPGDYAIGKLVSNILLPLDSSLETKQKLPFTVQLAEEFDAKIHLLKVYNTPLKVIRKRIDAFGEEAVNFLNEHTVEFELQTVTGENVAVAILKYVEKQAIDLITIMTEQGTTTANRFLGPYAQQLINNAPVPVMSLRSKDYELE
jgi:nucleotide-binding universal stress UspA family protein